MWRNKWIHCLPAKWSNAIPSFGCLRTIKAVLSFTMMIASQCRNTAHRTAILHEWARICNGAVICWKYPTVSLAWSAARILIPFSIRKEVVPAHLLFYGQLVEIIRQVNKADNKVNWRWAGRAFVQFSLTCSWHEIEIWTSRGWQTIEIHLCSQWIKLSKLLCGRVYNFSIHSINIVKD